MHARARASAARLLVVGGALALAVGSCGREPTGVSDAPGGGRWSQGIGFLAEFPPGYATFQAAGGTGVAFTTVRIVLRHADGTVALDTVVNFPAGATELPVTLNVPLPASAPASGVPLALTLQYVNAAGETVFTGGPVTVTAVPVTPGAGPPPPAQVTIPLTYTGPGANAVSVRISPRTLTVNTGGAFQFAAQALDASGAVVPATPIVFVSQNPVFANVNAATGAGVAGSARGDVSIVAQLLTGPTDAATLTIVSPAAAIAAVSGSGQTGPVNALLAQPVVVRVTATDGGPAAGVAVTFAAQNGGTVGAASATTDATGLAQTTWRLGPAAGAQTLTASSAGLSGSPVTFTATARSVDPVRLEIVTQPPATVAAGAAFGFAVRAVDITGALVPGFTGAVTVALGAGTPAGAVLSGPTTVNAVGGLAPFTGLSLAVPGTVTLAATASGLTGATTTPVVVTAGAAARLVFQNYPVAGATAGAVLDPITVVVRDALNNLVPTFTGAVTLTATSTTTTAVRDSGASSAASAGESTANVVLTGPVTVNAVAGMATFSNLQLTTAGSYTLTATASGLTGVTGPVFPITAGPASALVLVSGGGQSAAGGAGLPQPVVIKVTDAFGNGIAGVPVTFAPAAGSGSASPPSATTAAGGTAQTTWTLGGTAGPQTLNASATGLTPNPLVVTATATTGAAGGVASQLVFGQQPTNTVAGVAISPAITVLVKDALGAVVPTFTGNVTLALGANPGGGTLAGTTTVAAVAGVATFADLSIDKAGAGYTLTATSGALTGATSAAFTITAGAALSIVADSGNAQTGVVSVALAQQLVARVTDQFGNGVAGTSVTLAVATGGGSLSPTGAVTTDASGRVRTTWTLGPGTGAQSVTATSTGLGGSPVTFTATATGGAIVSTTLAQHTDSMHSLGDTLRRVPTSRDQSNAVVAGVYTYVSRNPAAATVDTGGLITAIANGTTYVVVTEAGGTRDSTLVVVQQRVATVNVTPGTRSIYRTRTFQFSAAAVDGRGNQMPGVTTFTWTTLAGSVATVDSTGFVTATGLGGTQVRATANAITGVANVTVLTPITRIIVGRDSSGVPVTDTTVMPSLGIGRRYRAEARDTLDAPMTGVTFAFVSTNPSVAPLDSITATTARALSNANGITTIQATADGITGSAALRVQQALASIELTPTPDTIGVTGTVQLTARGKDANNRYISGGTFTFASQNTAIATVNASGVVSGVALGTTNVTATSGAITSNNAVIVVSTTVSASISFGRDTLTVGRGSSTSIPVFLSRPHASNVVVNLAARDTNVYFSVASITFTPGQTSQNVTLNGRNAGTTLIYATDGSGTSFAGDTAAVAVQANIRFAQASWSLNATDQVASQVLLSDPSPAGGTFVTFSYGTAGRAQVSPDPAFIPAGQLASNVVITALGTTTGSTTITPSATGVNGTASTMNVSAPVLTISAGATNRLGAGQYEGGWYVYTPQYTTVAVPLTYSSTDTNVVTVSPATGAIPAGSYYQYFTVSGRAVGTAKVIISAAGWRPDTLTMTITSPRVDICCATTLNTTSPVTSATVYATDSLGNSHYRTSSLALSISSSDTNVIQIIDKTPSIGVGAYYVSGIRYQPGGSGGTAYIKVVAGGHPPDSMLVTVVGPKLQFSWNSNRLGKGQYDQNQYVYTPNNVTAPLTVTITSSDTTRATVTPAVVTVPTGSYYQYFNVNGLDTGFVTFIATAPGYQPDTATYRVTSPRVTMGGGGTYNNFRPPTGFTVYATDSVGNGHYRLAPLPVSLRSTDTNVIQVDSATRTIAAGTYYNSAGRVSFVGTGTAYIVATATGHRPDSVLYTVQTPKLNFSWTTTTLGRRQQTYTTDLYVYTPDYVNAPLTVTITQKRPAVDSISATTLTIPTSSYYQYLQSFALSNGIDTLIATATGYVPDTAYIRVTTPKFTTGGLPANAATTNPPATVYVYATDSLGSGHYVMDTVTVRAVSSDTNVIRPTQPYFRIPRGQYYTTTSITYTGPGTANITYSDSAGSGYLPVTTNNVTVTGPSLVFSNTNAMYGMRQRGGSSDYYVYTQNNVTSPVTVNLVSTDTRVATVPATVTIPTGSYYAYFTITAQDTVGTIQIQANAAGFGPPTPITVQVTEPRFVFSTPTSARTTQGPQYIYVYATDANGNGHYVTENVTVNLASSSTAIFTVDSATITLPAGTYYHNMARWLPVAVGSAQLSATDPRAAIYRYNTATANLSVTNPNLYFSWNSIQLGLGQYIDPVYDAGYYVYASDYQPAPLAVTLTHGATPTTTTPASVTIPASSYYQYFRITATALGTDAIAASASSPFHVPDTAYVVVDYGRIAFSGWPGASLTVGDSIAVTLLTRGPDSNTRRVSAATTFTLAPNANIEFRLGGAAITTVAVPVDGSQVTFYVKGLAAGSGTATISHANYTSNSPPAITVIP